MIPKEIGIKRLKKYLLNVVKMKVHLILNSHAWKNLIIKNKIYVYHHRETSIYHKVKLRESD